jgi:natural product biosynthesis luciferase-like monooxygenase protein
MASTNMDLSGIKEALLDHPSVAQVAVRSQVGADGESQSTAYIVLRERSAEARDLRFSLFYFADAEAEARKDKYRLYLEGARFADAHGFEAVWTPERHFHENGGLYPNPAVLSAALATITSNVRLRAGSVALPLHHSLRVAEEWSVVDNLSGGRVDLSFTSGWIPNDFAVAPQTGVFHRKRDAMFELLQQVQLLWEGSAIPVRDGVGNEVNLQIFPKPIQSRLPIWITCSGDPAMFIRAGEMGFNVLTALLTQPLEEAAEKAGLYRAARARAGLDPAGGCVTLMMHTLLGRDEAEVRAKVERPLTEYLKTHLDLMKTIGQSLNLKVSPADLTDPRLADYIASFAFERYYRMGSLIGTPDKCQAMVNRIKSFGFDEVACLIDFGVSVDSVLESLPSLYELKTKSDADARGDRERLQGYLRDRLGAGLPILKFVVVEYLPSDAGDPREAAPQAAAHATLAQSVDERAQKQKAAQERQRQVMRTGRKQ